MDLTENDRLQLLATRELIDRLLGDCAPPSKPAEKEPEPCEPPPDVTHQSRNQARNVLKKLGVNLSKRQ